MRLAGALTNDEMKKKAAETAALCQCGSKAPQDSASADRHRHENFLAVALDQKRDVLARLVDLLLQAFDGRYLMRSDADDHVARLDAGERGGTLRVLDDESAVAHFLAFLRRQRPHGEAELFVRR